MLFGDIQRSACNRLFNWWSNIQMRKHQKMYRLNTTFTIQLASGCCHRSTYPHACNISWTYPKLEEQYDTKMRNFFLVFMFGFQSLLGCIIGCLCITEFYFPIFIKVVSQTRRPWWSCPVVSIGILDCGGQTKVYTPVARHSKAPSVYIMAER